MTAKTEIPTPAMAAWRGGIEGPEQAAASPPAPAPAASAAHAVSDTDGDSGGETQQGERAPPPSCSHSALQALARVLAAGEQGAESSLAALSRGGVAGARERETDAPGDGRGSLDARFATGVGAHSSVLGDLPACQAQSTGLAGGEHLGRGELPPGACIEGQCAWRQARLALVEAEGPGLGIPAVGDGGGCPDFHLRISDGKYVGSIYRIPSIGEFPGIGRSRRNAICLLADDQVSRFQAYLDSTPDGHVRLCDGGRESGSRSSNGTFVNSNCARIEPAGHRLFYGDVIAVGATEMVVERGAVAETVCTSPPLQMDSGNNGWMRADSDNPWKRQMERGLSSTTFHTCVSRARKLAVAMGSHVRLGEASLFCLLTDQHLVSLILSYCTVTIHRSPAPALPVPNKLGCLELPVDVGTPIFGDGRLIAEQFLNSSSAPFPGACGGVGARACVALKVTRVR